MLLHLSVPNVPCCCLGARLFGDQEGITRKALDLEDSSGQRGKENFKAVPKHEAEISYFVVAVLVLSIYKMGDQETPGEEMRCFCFFLGRVFSQLFVWGIVSADLA